MYFWDGKRLYCVIRNLINLEFLYIKGNEIVLIKGWDSFFFNKLLIFEWIFIEILFL